LNKWGRGKDIVELEDEKGCATVEIAAQNLGVIPARIAKGLAIYAGDGVMVIIASGTVKLDNVKFKKHFGFRPKMVSADDVPRLTGHFVGGVCPFALPKGVEVYLDISLKGFDTVFPACSSTNSVIEVTIKELLTYTNNALWVDVCKEAFG
jgi:prolyl-tRNA editing enzyme YbaK/EbsC (Cys-tRNA(Pro) deacylase)